MSLDRSAVQDLEIKYGIPNDLYYKVLTLGEKSGPTAVSPKGAIGYAQLLPGTAREMGVDPWDVGQNLEGGAKYLSKMYNMFGDWRTATAAYNAGPGAVKKAGGVPNFPETQAYQNRIWGTTPMPDMPNTAVTPAEKQGLADLQKASAHSADVGKSIDDHLAENRKRYEEVEAELRKITESPRPQPPTVPDLPNAPQQDDYIKDPTRVLGQVLPGLAILMGARGRRGAINSLTAAGAAMKAARENDKESFERANETWKNQMQATLQHAEMERQRYLDVLEDRRMSMSEKLSQMSVFAAEDKNDQMRMAIASGDVDRIYKNLQVMDQLAWRGYQVYDMAQRRQLESQRVGLEGQRVDLEKQKAADLAQYRKQQIDVAKSKGDVRSASQLYADLIRQKQDAANGVGTATWGPADEAALADVTATLQHMNYDFAKGGVQEGTKDTPIPLPANAKASDLKEGQVYQTAKGPGRWNGKAFEAVK